MVGIKTKFTIVPLAIVALVVQSIICEQSTLSFGDYEQSMILKQTNLVSSLKTQVNLLMQQADKEYEIKKAEISTSQEIISPESNISEISPKQKIAYFLRIIYCAVFQKIDLLYVEAINQLEQIKKEYDNTKNVVYNIRNISAWTPFDATIEQLINEKNDYNDRRNCIEMFKNVDLDAIFDFNMAIDHC